METDLRVSDGLAEADGIGQPPTRSALESSSRKDAGNDQAARAPVKYCIQFLEKKREPKIIGNDVAPPQKQIPDASPSRYCFFRGSFIRALRYAARLRAKRGAVRAELDGVVQQGAPGITAIAMRDGELLFRSNVGQIDANTQYRRVRLQMDDGGAGNDGGGRGQAGARQADFQILAGVSGRGRQDELARVARRRLPARAACEVSSICGRTRASHWRSPRRK